MFFLDDKYHEQMVHHNVYYINIKQYVYNYTYNELINTNEQFRANVNKS